MKTSRNTVARTTILDIITDSNIALSHAEIKDKTKNLCDRVTIYRVLDRLVDEGLVHKIVNIDGVVKYASCEICTEEHHHHDHHHVHFSCELCKSVTCLDEVQPTFKLPENYKIKEIHFTISGICPKCK